MIDSAGCTPLIAQNHRNASGADAPTVERMTGAASAFAARYTVL